MYTDSGVNIKTDKLLLEPVTTLIEDKEMLKKMNQLYLKINMYTLKRDKFFKSFAVRQLIKDIEYEDEYHINHYKDDDYDFRFDLLSDQIEGKSMIRELKSKKRFHKCHESSIGMCLQDEDDSMKVLIGYIPCIDNEELHSIIEYKEQDAIYIIDYTQNLMMLKDDYITINKYRVVNEVSSESLKKDLSIMIELGIRTPFYLMFRDEIMRDLKKNSRVLKLED